jgi:hypothetical protein
VVKGNLAADAIIAGPATRTDRAVLRADKPMLLVRNALGQSWSSIGTIGIEHAGWLRQLAATYQGERSRPVSAWRKSTDASQDLSEAAWRARAALVAPYLEHADPLAADIAHGEISRAPYTVLRTLKPQLAAADVARWIDDASLTARRSTYLLLLGIAGGKGDAAILERRIGVAWASRDATHLAAMLTADLELRGSSGVDSIEKMYLADDNRTLAEIEAALLALKVHGDADAAVRRARVIAAYRVFMGRRKPMAGFVAAELADWGHWDATQEYAELLRSNAVKDPAAHFMIVNYLQRSPHAAARAALRSLAKKAQ